MTKYDASALGKFADELYRRAQRAILLGAVLGLLLGLLFIVPVCVSIGYKYGGPALAGILGICGLAVGGMVGYVLGQNRAFHYRFEAQLALCQRAIEQNTRNARRDEA